jgi:CRISPR-associated protein Cas1
VLEDEREVAVIPAAELDRIEIGPGIGATTAALRLGFACGIPIGFLDGRGATAGVCGPEPSHHAALHLAQARCVLDPSRRLDLARRIVLGRIHNQRALLHRLNRRRGDRAVQAAFERLRDIEARARHAQSVDGLLGLEGYAAALYWPAWAGMLARGWEFGGRSRRPPEDPANVLLSFLSGILHRDLLALAGRHGLHPGFGALHGTRDGHVGCISDLIEEFRAPLIEGLAAYLVNNRHLSPEMFVRRDCGGWRILTIGHQRVVAGYERWLHRPVRSPRSGRDILWRRVLEEQVVAYARHVRGVAEYRPYRMGY